MNSYSVYTLLCNASCTQQHIFEIDPCFCCVSVVCFFFIPELYVRVWLCHSLFIHALFNRHLSCFQFLTTTSIAAMNILVQVFCKHVFISLGSTPRSGMRGHKVGGQYRNPIDYVIGSRRWRGCVRSAKTRPGADCGTDHELLIKH